MSNFDLPNTDEHKNDIQNLRIGFVAAGLSHLGEQEAPHAKLVQSAVDGASAELERLGVDVEAQVMNVTVPGVLEIPLMAQKLIESKQVDGIVGFALIVNGEIYRHEFVAQASLDALLRVGLDTGVPVASCMLTPVQPKSPETQFDMLNEHLVGKGKECALALVEQILQLKAVKEV